MPTFFRSLAILAACTMGAQAMGDLQSCYYFSGDTAANNTVCDGSSSCCGPTATCESYKLCHNPGDPDDVFVRGPCAVMGWGTDNCPSLCQYDETTGVFPRVKQCPDQSWCCSNKTGTAVNDDVKDCCSKGQGVFIDALGNVISHSTSLSAPSSLPTATTTTATIKPTASATKTKHKQNSSNATSSPTASTSPSATPEASGGLSTGAKAGIGAGVGIAGAIVAIGLIMFFVRRKQSKNSPYHQPHEQGSSDDHNDISYGAYRPYKDGSQQQEGYTADAKYAQDTPAAPVEAVGNIPGQMHSEAGRFEMADNAIAPQELEGDGGWKTSGTGADAQK